MGSPEDEVRRDDDEVRHQVTLTRPLWLARHEVTQAEWRALMGSAPFDPKTADPAGPANMINWFEAVSYLNARPAR
jgi:formylglycine-generating enzyme required for sulfatase activity